MGHTISYEDDLLAIKHGVWVTPVMHSQYHGNRVSVNRFTGETYLIGNLNWLISEFDKRKIKYDILSEVEKKITTHKKTSFQESYYGYGTYPRTTDIPQVIEKATVEDATHLLSCKHCISRSCVNYSMKCLPLAKTKSGRVKILVFGDRNWAGKSHIKKVRYVPDHRVKPIT